MERRLELLMDVNYVIVTQVVNDLRAVKLLDLIFWVISLLKRTIFRQVMAAVLGSAISHALSKCAIL